MKSQVKSAQKIAGKIGRGADELIRTIILVILLVLTPTLFYRTESEVKVDFRAPLEVLGDLGDRPEGLGFFDFTMGKTTLSVFDVLPGKIMITFSFIFCAAILCVLYALILGLILPTEKRWFKELTGLIGIIPDFILILLMQLAAVALTQTLGFRVFRIAWSSAHRPAVFLPLFVMTVMAGTYLVRMTGQEKAQLEKSEYIRFARARGIGGIRLTLKHLMPGILNRYRSELITVLSIITGNMFIIERLYNIPGLTRFMFSYIFITDYWYFVNNNPLKVQIVLGVLCLLGLAAIFMMTYGLILLLLSLAMRLIDR